MKLTLVLLKRKYPRGNIFSGKFRLVKEPTPHQLKVIRSGFAMEETNMLYLRNPYVSAEEWNSVADTNAQKWDKLHMKFRERQYKQFTRKVKDRTLERYLGHMRHTDAWE